MRRLVSRSQLVNQNGLNVDLVVQAVLVSRLPTKPPIAGGGLGDRNFNVIGGNPNFRLNFLKQQIDQLFLRFNRAAFDHTEFNNRISIGATRWHEEIFRVKVKKPMGAFVSGERQRFDNTGMDRVG